MILLECINIEKNVCIETSVECWILNRISNLNGTCIAEQYHDCQRCGLHYLYFINSPC